MPTASDEKRELMQRWFGCLDERGPIKVLSWHGYVLTREWEWIKPTPNHTISDIEYECISFLIDEWDFGGIRPEYRLDLA